jgi:hypothetical protein
VRSKTAGRRGQARPHIRYQPFCHLQSGA